ALKTAAQLQRERLEQAPLSKEARRLIREVETALSAKLRYLSWAFYGNNQPSNPIHKLLTQHRAKVWAALKARKQALAEKGAAFVAASASSRGPRRSSNSAGCRSTAAHSVAQV